MAKQESRILHMLAWFTGIVVSLVVGNAMIQQSLIIPSWLGGATNAGIWITWAIGWIVVVTTIISAVMAILKS